jgi:hypothetical protein
MRTIVHHFASDARPQAFERVVFVDCDTVIMDGWNGVSQKALNNLEIYTHFVVSSGQGSERDT